MLQKRARAVYRSGYRVPFPMPRSRGWGWCKPDPDWTPSPVAVTRVLDSPDFVGNAQGMQRQSAARSDLLITSFRGQPVRVFRSIHWNARVGPRLRQWLRDQQFSVFIGALVCLALWALRLQTPYLQIMVMSVCIGNVLNTVMRYAGRWYEGLNPPWNWVVYLPLLAGISFLGSVISAVLLNAMSAVRVPFLESLRMTAPFSVVVCMTVGVVSYSVARIQVRLREKNLQLEIALQAETDAVRIQEQELVRARQIQQELMPKSIPQLRGVQVAGAWQPAPSAKTISTWWPSTSTGWPSASAAWWKGHHRRIAYGEPAGGVSRLRHRPCQSRRSLQQVECIHFQQRRQREIHILLLLHCGCA